MSLSKFPKQGRFGEFGGKYVPETLNAALTELEASYEKARKDKKFKARLDYFLREYAWKTYSALSRGKSDAKIPWCEDLPQERGSAPQRRTQNQQRARSGTASEINGKKRIIAETGAGQHGVATAMACAALGLKCEV